MELARIDARSLKLQVYADRRTAGEAAARDAADTLKELGRNEDRIGVIFATGDSQLETLRALTAIPGLPWERVSGFHLDEYVGIDQDHFASFRRYLRENLTERVPMQRFFEINGDSCDPARVQREYVKELNDADPQLCLLGIGENGHLAFNDPAEADFDDPGAMKIVTLDSECRQQQLAEGWFDKFEDVPERAMTLTIPTIMKVRKLIVSIPGRRKSRSIRRTLLEPISTACPATILRTHPNVTLYLDEESAAELGGLV
ncbi:MAG TPA: glucosamine-6-phosphate deaminase [Terracidiphilus sp.]|jgi:glucosamine-6-phosphate deaminase